MHRKENFPRDASPRKNLNRKPLSSTTPEKKPRHSGQTPPAINLFCQYLTSPQRRIVINVLVLTCSFSGGERNEIPSGHVTFSCSSRRTTTNTFTHVFTMLPRPRFPRARSHSARIPANTFSTVTMPTRARPDPHEHEHVPVHLHEPAHVHVPNLSVRRLDDRSS